MRTKPTLSRRVVASLVVLGALLIAGSPLTTCQPAAADDTPPFEPVLPWLASPEQFASDVQNYLLNGGLNGDYYYVGIHDKVAPDWNRWWIAGSNVPEYDRSKPSDPYIEGDRSQRWHFWGNEFVAGIYQVADVTPCVIYQLSAWSQATSIPGAQPHARVGLDASGTQLTSGPTSGSISAFPALTAWSSEQTSLFTWENWKVTAEAVNDKVTAIFYSAPQRPNSSQTPYYAYYWDDAWLIEVPFPGDKLPEPSSWTPSGFISSVSTQVNGDSVTVNWQTSSPASTQVWYTIVEPTEVLTPSESMTYTVYMPIIASFRPPSAYMTPVDTTPVTDHAVTVSGLPTDKAIVFVALSRRPDGSTCATEVSDLIQLTLSTNRMMTLESSEAPVLLANPIAPER